MLTKQMKRIVVITMKKEIGLKEFMKHAVENMPKPGEIDFSKEVENNEAKYLIAEGLVHGHSVKYNG